MMGKYSNLTSDIFSVFSSSEWQSTGYKTIPADFVGKDLGDQFLRISVLSSGRQPANSLKSVSGMLMIEIFVPAGLGPSKVNQIADKLDEFLAGKTLQTSLGGTTQLSASTLSGGGPDTANSSLYRIIYSISFNYFGV